MTKYTSASKLSLFFGGVVAITAVSMARPASCCFFYFLFVDFSFCSSNGLRIVAKPRFPLFSENGDLAVMGAV
jgi:hypothetical protein